MILPIVSIQLRATVLSDGYSEADRQLHQNRTDVSILKYMPELD